MAAMREFITAAKAVSDEQEEELSTSFMVDGQELKSYHPGEGQLALLMAAVAGDYQSTAESASTVINFFFGLLDDDSRAYVKQRLLDRNDEFGIAQVTVILEWLVEQWSGNPTKSLSVSTSSPVTTGETSTESAPSQDSTHSDSPQLASATSSTTG